MDELTKYKFNFISIFTQLVSAENWGEWTIDSLALTIDEGLTLETSAFLLFMVANLRFQLSCYH